MEEKKILNMEELMVDYAEMTSFNFNSLDFLQVEELHKFTDGEYANIPYSEKYGKFDLLDMIQSFIGSKTVRE